MPPQLTLILQAIVAAFKFPSEVVAMARFFEGTTQEQREKILAATQAEAENYQKTGRPSWD